VEWWRDLDGAVRWLAAAAGLGVWALTLATVSRLARPRQVTPDRTTVDAPGEEPAALAATLTNHWSLDRDAVPATVLDLAARDHLSVRSLNGQVMVYVPDHRERHPRHPVPGEERGETLTPYERMVMDRLRRRARLSRDGGVPAEALLHATRGNARRWWRRFRKAVYQDAARRGLARRRWPAWAVVVVLVASLAAALVLGFALMAAVLAASDADSGEGIYAGVFYGLAASVGLLLASFNRPRLRDTPAGREAAARWLGFRSALASDPMVTNLDAAGTSAGGRRLAYAGAMGLAPAAVDAFAALHRGAQREAWSPVTGSWRRVRLAYPRLGMSVYGLSPGASIAVALFVLAMLTPFGIAMGQVLASAPSDDPLVLTMLVLSFALPLSPVLLFACVNLGRGVLDLSGERDLVEGSVLRIHHVREGRISAWYVIVDDGTSDVLHPWKLRQIPEFGVNARVRGQVSRHGRHVRDVEVLEEGDPIDDDLGPSASAALQDIHHRRALARAVAEAEPQAQR
jgi:predicted membrane protein DUF2207